MAGSIPASGTKRVKEYLEDKKMKVCVVGGGTAGFIAATIIKKFLDVEVMVIHSKKIGIVGVGEGSTEHFSEYMDFIGISHHEIIKKCDATYKAGIFFDGWTEKPYMHFVGFPFIERFAQYNYIYANQISKKNSFIVPQSIYQNKIDPWFLEENSRPPFNQFHFNTNKLNDYLQELSEKMGISIVDDEILEVFINSSGNIEHLVGEKDLYYSDFFIDATGFKKILIEKMGSRWVSFNKYLKMNSAIVFPTYENKDYNLYTTAKSMNSGWAFSLPVWERSGNGYIFDNNYISVDEAKQEIFEKFGAVDFGKEFNFDAGYLESSWINNCVAVGLSSSFVEPLEATSIGTTIQQSFMLMHKITNYSKTDIDKYNKSFKLIMENIRDFVFLHYMVKNNSSKFWRDMSEVHPPDSLKEKLDLWEKRLPIYEDFSADSQYALFRDPNYIVVMDGIGMINKKNIKDQFLKVSYSIRAQAQQKINNYIHEELYGKKISHREIIEAIRNNT